MGTLVVDRIEQLTTQPDQSTGQMLLHENQKRIVVEGMDGSGKSTLVSSLLIEFQHLNPRYVRNDRGPDRDLGLFWMDELMSPVDLTIHDRFFYPELVYGPVLRGSISVNPVILDAVHDHLRNQAFLVYCRPPTEVIEREIHRDRQWPGVIENQKKLLEQYDNVMAHELPFYNNRFFTYNWIDNGSWQALTYALEAYLA